MASISLSQVTKSFHQRCILKNLSLEIKDQEFLVLVGPSGCGKSTLLRVMGGLESVQEGSIRLGGRDVQSVSARDRNVAMVFQNYALYPHMSVAENLGFSMKLRKVSHTEIAVRVNQVAHTLGISHLLDAKPKALSGGQRQRVAMGRAMIREPEVFLFDEPLSNLDAQLRTQMRTEIKKLHQDLRTTMVYVTHDQVEAMTLADRIVVLKEGEIQQIGTPMEVYQRPQNHFVASFMGSPSMNFIPGVHCAHSIQSPLLSKRLLISAWGQALSLLENQEIWIAFRPEHLILGRIENAWNFRAKVRVIEPLGAEMLVSFELVESAGETLWGQLKATGIGYKGPYDSNLRVGRVLDLSCPFKDVHFFDRASGVRAS